MEAINACILFLVNNFYYWIAFFVIYLAFIGQAIHAYFRLERPEIKNEFTPMEIEITRERIRSYLRGDIIITSILFLLVILSLGLKLWFMYFPPVTSLIK